MEEGSCINECRHAITNLPLHPIDGHCWYFFFAKLMMHPHAKQKAVLDDTIEMMLFKTGILDKESGEKD